MKTKLLSIAKLIVACLIIHSLYNCNAQKDVEQRRKLMMPKKDELPKNYKKYDLKETRKSYKVKKGKVKKTKKRLTLYTNNQFLMTLNG